MAILQLAGKYSPHVLMHICSSCCHCYPQSALFLARRLAFPPSPLQTKQYVGEEDPLSLITEFVAGYAKHADLNKTEMEILPDLINLRIFSNVIYFTGR